MAPSMILETFSPVLPKLVEVNEAHNRGPYSAAYFWYSILPSGEAIDDTEVVGERYTTLLGWSSGPGEAAKDRLEYLVYVLLLNMELVTSEIKTLQKVPCNSS